MTTDRTIALVLDDRIIRKNYADFLGASGYRVDMFGDRAAAIEAFSRARPDLAILDATLGVESADGLLLCSDIRTRWPRLPVVMLSSGASEEDRISGLRAGADDCILRDVSLRLLGVRLEALLERCDALRERPTTSPDVIALGPLRIDSRWSEVRWRKRPVQLSFTSYRVVRELAADAPRPKTPEELMQAAETRVERNTVSARIRGIRLRFREIDPSFDNIRTERGHGYRWVP